MDKNKFEKLNNRVIDASGVSIHVDYLDSEYEIKTADDIQGSTLSNENEVIVAELIPSRIDLPHFKFRSDCFGENLDVDVYINGKRNKKWWITNNCKGHHGEPSKRPFYFKRKIECQNDCYFEGSISIEKLFQRFSCERSIEINGT